MQFQLDLFSKTTWIAAGALFGVLIPLIVFLSGDELLLTIIAAAMGTGIGYALWAAQQRQDGSG